MAAGGNSGQTEFWIGGKWWWIITGSDETFGARYQLQWRRFSDTRVVDWQWFATMTEYQRLHQKMVTGNVRASGGEITADSNSS